MVTSTQKTVVFSSIFVLWMAAHASACSCRLPNHPQDYFCDSQFVIRAHVLYRTEAMNTPSAAYHVHVLDVLKVPETSSLLPDVTTEESAEAVLHTGLSGSSCGVYLQEDRTYILGGGVRGDRLSIGLCGLHMLDDEESLNQRLRADFYHKFKNNNCDCPVQYSSCSGICIVETVDQCFVDRSMGFSDAMACDNPQAMCKRRDGFCRWSGNSNDKQCQDQPPIRRLYKNLALKRGV